ncbi:solute carrier family 23 protein [Streptomyces sp. Q6]|uniref:Solute carrier family 23 protein n=1 Tax=Streptomyces citrinus TaxID=3118173 RepID=A0ACD5A676_9ACTN
MAVVTHAVAPAPDPHPVDVRPPLRRLVPLSLQHLLVAYAGMATMPLLVGTALHLPEDRIRLLISANLLVSGLATILQSMGFKWFGARLPIVMGSTFTAITPAILIGAEHGLAAVFGATIVSGLVTVAVAPWFGRWLHLFPPLVTGTVIAVIGFSLVPSAAGLVTGGQGGSGGRGSPSPRRPCCSSCSSSGWRRPRSPASRCSWRWPRGPCSPCPWACSTGRGSRRPRR